MKENKSFESKSLGEQLKSGVFWQYTQTAFITGFNFVAGIILARLLDLIDSVSGCGAGSYVDETAHQRQQSSRSPG